MRRITPPRLVLLTGLLLMLLLCGEAWLLADSRRQQQLEHDQASGRVWLQALTWQLQTRLDHARLLALQVNHEISPAGLDEWLGTLRQQDAGYTEVALVERITAAQRPALEARLGQPIRDRAGGYQPPAPPRPFYYVRLLLSGAPDSQQRIGVDLGARADWMPTFESALNTQRPRLHVTDAPLGSPPRLDIVSPLPQQSRVLLLRLNPSVLLSSPLTDGTAPVSQLRLVAWQAQQPDTPFLDSHPGHPLPASAPLQARTLTLGGMTLQYAVFALSPPALVLQDHDLLVLMLSAAGALCLLVYLYHLGHSNLQFRHALLVKHDQLMESNRSLHRQLDEHRSAEQALADSEARQRAILEASSDAILLLERDGTVRAANAAAVRLTGRHDECLPHQPLASLFPDWVDPARHRPFDQIAAEHAGAPFEAQLRCEDGSRLPVELTLSQVDQPDDTCFLLVCRNIRQRKEQEAALLALKNTLEGQVEQQRQQLAALLDASPLAMAYVADHRFKQVNRAFLELFRLPAGDVVEQPTTQIFESVEQWQRLVRLLYGVLTEGQVCQQDLRLRDGDGGTLWCQVYGKALDPALPGLGSVWIYQDISAQRATEAALREAKTLAEDTSRAKTEFLANMSHELRTPLHAILGFAEMGERRSASDNAPKQQHYFERIHRSGKRLLTLLNDLLDLAKMEVKRMEFQMMQQDLLRCVYEARDEMLPMAAKNGIDIILKADSLTLPAVFDPLRIGQVMRNLLANAIKVSPSGGVITVHVAPLADANGIDWVEVAVSDQGPGIADDELEPIFDKFVQGSATKTGAGGSGLGLSICREIVLAHDGEISAGNADGGGAIFRFILPRWPRPAPLGTEHDGTHATLG
ncbi:sensor histidine kinase [Pseudogulbenkiania subflava]|uniref:histidine kinase n=1 Tax=Pseudogulbenkiania subflava DSM 22618 TaxID=1123014 RepID=A0A1Y6CBP5_9NEIS|nr:ATP-binding protein [Pseudogulbenkiania subflava]SMF55704.1 PAS domain S-box-containing protein [Pseudogulbenkiania subflava DSM 22618]